MTFTDAWLNDIYDRTAGRCHLCGKRLSFHNYGLHGQSGAWHVEHSVPRARGGTNRRPNLYAGCIPCNLFKGTTSTRTVRAWHGRRRAPLSKARREKAHADNVILGILIGAMLGASLEGARGAVWGGLAGGCVGWTINPE